MLTASFEDAEFFYRLLHLYHGVPQRDGKYAGLRKYVSAVDVAAHLRGEISLAFCISTRYETGNKRWARFIAIDVDKKFAERLPVLSATLTELKIAQAAFATNGSSPGKGKVIVTFSKMVNREEAYALARLIHSTAHRLNPDLIPAKPASGDIELFPKRPTSIAWDGGLVRVLGRNAGRNGPLETALDLDGCEIDLRDLKPLAQSRVSKLALALIVANRKKKQPKRIDRLIAQPWTWTCFGGVKQMWTKMVGLARYFMETLGPEAGRVAYIAALTDVKSHSPDLDTPSPKNLDRRNPVGRELDELSAWDKALSREIWEPIAFEVIITRPLPPLEGNDNLPEGNEPAPTVPQSAQNVYNALVQHVRAEGLRPHCFGIDQRTLAAMLQISQPGCAKNLYLAETYGLLVTLHPGTSNSEAHGNDNLTRPRRSVKAGVPAMYGLVGKGETIYDVYAEATQDAHLKERRAKHPVQKIMPEALAIIGRLVVESYMGTLPVIRTKSEAA